MTYSSQQKEKANEVLGVYASQGAVFTSQIFQQAQYIFRATLPSGQCKFVVIGQRGKVIDHGWS